MGCRDAGILVEHILRRPPENARAPALHKWVQIDQIREATLQTESWHSHLAVTVCQVTSGDRGPACDRRVVADQADSDAPLTALRLYPCP